MWAGEEPLLLMPVSFHAFSTFRFCFSNKMSTLTTKLVVFSIVVGSDEDKELDNLEGICADDPIS